ncbi:peptidase S24/S26A/S26B/S26C [Schizophyllum amplum]|uniref:Mitochondrial inner membrane protease subunit n=1 Tax=Schizophyllum amplum TaxID=97359 RepID=A0A550CT29_9AGAR|nr:peptidase S24/S26A/S26B/S26C [Auriculariopsis ampla]
MQRLRSSLRWSRFPRSILYWSPLLFFSAHQFPIHTVLGRSMQPTLNPDESMLRSDIGLFCRLPIYGEDFRRGDIVAMRSPTNPHRMLIKRIIALPGDTVKALQPYPAAQVDIPEGHMWVEGDDPYHSYDSNHFGAVPLGLVESKLTGLLWPLERAGSVNRLHSSQRALERRRLRDNRLVKPIPSQKHSVRDSRDDISPRFIT